MFPVTKRKGGTPQAGVSGETHRFRRKEPLQGWRWGTLDWFPKPVLLLRQGSPHTGALPLDVIPVPTSLGPVIPWFPSPHLELDCLHWVLMLLGGGVHDWEKEGTWTPPWLGSHLLGGLTFHTRKISLFLEYALYVPSFTWPSASREVDAYQASGLRAGGLGQG